MQPNDPSIQPQPAIPNVFGSQDTPPSVDPQTPIPNKTLPLKYVPIVLVVSIVLSFIYSYFDVGYLGLVILIIAMVVAWVDVTKIKSTSDNKVTEKELSRSVWLMSISPVFAQAIYYYRLKKSHPNKAKFYNKLGWVVLGVEIVISVIVSVILLVSFTHKLQNAANSTVSQSNTNTSSTN